MEYMYRQASGWGMTYWKFLLYRGENSFRIFNIGNRRYCNYPGELELVTGTFMVGIFQFYYFMFILTAFFSTCRTFFHAAITTFASLRVPKLHAYHFAHTIMQMYG